MPFWSPGGLAAVVLAHLGILAALMSVRSAPLPAPLETLMVRMIHEVPAEPPKPPPPVPRPPAPKPPVVKPPASSSSFPRDWEPGRCGGMSSTQSWRAAAA